MAPFTMNFTRQLLLAAATFGTFALATPLAHGEKTAASRAELTNEDALVRFALTHNLELRAAHWEQDIAAADVTSAAALNNPVARGEWLHVQSPANYGWGVGVEWAPPQPGVYGAGTDAARSRARAVKADFSERSADLEANVRRSYAQIAALGEEITAQ